MYFINRNEIEKTLQYMEKVMGIYKGFNESMNEVETLAFERCASTIIEGILDVGNSIIDGFIMRDPGSYEDIIDILVDERVLSNKVGENVKQVIGLRKELIQQYATCDTKKCLAIFRENDEAIAAFPSSVRTYLENELGPISAFMP
ncbi:MAG: DUF86 domain-containing protein [Bacillaceae bacterium]